MAIKKPSAPKTLFGLGPTTKYLVVGALIVVAFFASYRYAQANSGRLTTNNLAASGGYAVTGANPGGSTGAAGGAGAGGCCGGGSGGAGAAGAAKGGCCGGGQPTANGVTGPVKTGTAAVVSGVQRISVDVSKSIYEPNVLKLKAGIPAEITFGQGSGCTGYVQSPQLGFQADLTSGPQTVRIDAPKKGTYAFTCGMSMVYGKIVVE